MRSFINRALAKGYNIQLEDAEGVILRYSTSYSEIVETIEAVEECHLYLKQQGCLKGSIFIVDGEVCDHSINAGIEELLVCNM